MATRLNFSEADSVSVSSICEKNPSKDNSSKFKPDSEFASKFMLTREQQLFEEQFLNGYTEMETKKK